MHTVCREINTFSKTFFFSKENILTVACVNTSSSDFIQDHVLRTTWKAALHTAKYILFFDYQVKSELFSQTKGELRFLRREKLAAFRIWVTASVGTRACTGLVAPLAHDTVWDDKTAL